MKLIYCRGCGDVVRLIEKRWRVCDCGKSGGQYNIDQMTATVGGNCAVFGIGNPFFYPIVPYLGDGALMEKWRNLNGYEKRDIWYGEYPGDVQIFRVASAEGPRLKVRVFPRLEKNLVRVIDKRVYTLVGPTQVGFPFGRPVTLKEVLVPANPLPSFKVRRGGK